MRILEVITTGDIGGAQTVLADLVKGFVKHNDVEIDIFFGDGEYLPKLLGTWNGGEIIRSAYLGRNINPIKDISAFFELLRLCKKKRYDIIHCHSSKASWIGRLAAVVSGVPKVYVTVHGLSFRPGISKAARFIYKNVERLLVPIKSEYIFVSATDMKEMMAMGLAAHKCKVIPNGRPEPEKPEKGLREQLLIHEDTSLICMIGRLSEQKNPLSFIRVAKKVIDQYPEGLSKPKFILIGDGPYYKDCKIAINKEGLSDYVYLYGSAENAAQYFWDSDLAVLTSNYEACPLVAIEALATGTPVIATNTGGTGTVIEHNETGYLFPVNDEDVAANYITKLLSDKSLYNDITERCLVHYKKRFAVDRMVEEYTNCFGLGNKRGEMHETNT